MAQDPSGLAACHVTLEDMQVGAADGRLADSNDGIRWCGDFRLRVILKRLFPRAQAEVQAEVVAGDEARLALYFLCLDDVTAFDYDSASDGAAVGFSPNQLYLEPGIRAGDIVS